MAYADNEHLHPYGTTIEVSVDNVTFAFVNDLISIDPPNATRGKSDDTTLKSTNEVKLSTPGWIEAGDLTVECYLHKTQLATLEGYFWGGNNPLYWRITLPKLSTETVAGSIVLMTGWISEFRRMNKVEQGSDEKIKVMYKIVVTDKPTWTAGS